LVGLVVAGPNCVTGSHEEWCGIDWGCGGLSLWRVSVLDRKHPEKKGTGDRTVSIFEGILAAFATTRSDASEKRVEKCIIGREVPNAF
jgi:hypothetical protein